MKEDTEPYDLYDTDLGEIESEAINERYKEFKVCRPTKVGSVFMYEVFGYTKEGSFKGMKRYSDFDKLRKVMLARWPGYCIAAIPPKQMFVSACCLTSAGRGQGGVREGAHDSSGPVPEVDRQTAVLVQLLRVLAVYPLHRRSADQTNRCSAAAQTS